MAPSLKLTAAMRPGVSGRITTDSFDFRLPTALASSEKSAAAIFATSNGTLYPNKSETWDTDWLLPLHDVDVDGMLWSLPNQPEQMLPAAGQGALGIEIRTSRADVNQIVSVLRHPPSWLAVSAERAVSRVMGGSCSMPLAAYATFAGDVLTIRATWGDPEGMLPLVHARAQGVVTDVQAAVQLGEGVAQQLQAAVTTQTAKG